MVSILANHLWQSTLFAVVAGLLTLVFRNNGAHIRHGLWLSASLKFLLPFSLLIVLGGQFVWHAAAVSSSAAGEPQQWSILIDRLAEPLAGSARPATTPAAAPVKSVDWLLVAFAVWLGGVAVVLCLSLLRWFRISAVLRAAQPFVGHLLTGQPIKVMSSSAMLEPGIIGVFRPVLLMPHGIQERLTPEQLQAIVAHELSHVRRRDNLTGLIHMIVQTVFWFHPLVWWIGARMIEERERACDEAVLAGGSEPAVYAEGLLNVCELYLASPLVCASGVSGADLKKRIEAIMRSQVMDRLSVAKKALLAAAAVIAVAVPVVTGLLHAPAARAQAPAAATADSPAFATVSITLGSPEGLEKSLFVDPRGPFTVRNLSLRQLIGFAYDLQGSEIVGPAELLSQLYSMDAQTAVETSADEAIQQARARVRRLLAERFMLTFHWDTKRVPVYALVGGANAGMKEAATGDPGPLFSRGMNSAGGHAAPVQLLTRFLAEQLGRPVLDQTGLTGRYNFTVKWGSEPTEPDVANVTSRPVDPSTAVLIDAVQQQLGLHVVAQDGDVKLMAIDRVAQPAGLVLPPQVVAIDATVLDHYVGYYALPGSVIMTVSRDGDRFLTQLPGQPQVPFFAKSEREFFARLVDAQITFVTGADGDATQLVLHQNGHEITASRVNESVAKAQADALATRVREQKALPGSEAMLRKVIEALQHDRPDYDDLTPAAAAAVRPQWPMIEQLFSNVGELQEITFKRVGPGGADIYDARFEKRAVEWRIGLNSAGKIDRINYRMMPAS